jgi:hypothetical protein
VGDAQIITREPEILRDIMKAVCDLKRKVRSLRLTIKKKSLVVGV